MGDTARNRRCANEPLPGSKYCLVHQHLANLSGMRNGRFTKALGNFAQTYQESLNDRDLYDLREPLAAMDMLLQRMMERLSDLDTADFRNRARTHLLEYRANMDAARTEDAKIALNNLSELLKRGGDEDELSQRLIKNLQGFMRRLEGAWEIKLQRRSAVNAKEVVAALGRMLDILRTETTTDVYARCVERFDLEILKGAGHIALLTEKMPREVQIESSSENDAKA